jgi:glycosyltransferase involved in cell wall biosynthesis
LAVLLSLSGKGGVEKMVMNLLPEFVRQGVEVDLLAIVRKASNDVFRIEGSGARVVDLGVRHTSLAVPALARYLKAERPAVLLAAKDRAIRTAVAARRLSGVDVRLVGRLGTHLSAALEGKPAWMRWLRCQPMRWLYPQVDHIVAVSEGVAYDTVTITGLAADRVSVIRNPVITPGLWEKSREPVDHPWFDDGGAPVILGAGRLTRQKDFPTLIRAFALLGAERRARLVILGEGRLRRSLETLAEELGLCDKVSLPGFVANPYAYMAKASLFVLSSAWEGSPNVLTEALALGVPVASTDCPSGPREILDEGRYGRLVPPADVEALAQAMAATLDDPLEPEFLRQAARAYTVENSCRAYLRVFGLNGCR